MVGRLPSTTAELDIAERVLELAAQGFGGVVDHDLSTIRAGIAALEGRTTEALGLYRSALAGYREAGCRFDVALTILDMAALVGTDEPAVRSLIPEGRDILVSLGARPLIERLDALAGEGGRRASVGRSRSGRGAHDGPAHRVNPPDVSYARSGDVSIAYQVVGDGPVDIVFVRGITGDLLSTWDQPLLVRHVEGLAANGRLLMLDKRGTGLSDRVREVQSLETTMDDIRAVMDAAGSERAVLWSGATSTGLSLLFAATYPDRCLGLVLFDPRIKATQTADYPWAPTQEEWRQQLADARNHWGERDFLEELAGEWAPEVADDDGFRDWFVWHMRRSLSPGAALTAFRSAMETDVSDVLGAVRVPTLILPRPALPGPGFYAAERIRGAELVELPSFQGLFTWVDDAAHEATMAATAQFISRLAGPTATERVLATILFTDIVGSTEQAARLGDTAWRELLGKHHAIVRRELARHHGRELDTAGDGFFAAFDGPARAVQAAAALREPLAAIGLEVRAGLHTGECEVERRQDRRHRGLDRCPDLVAGGTRRDPGQLDREGPDRRLGPRLRGCRRARAQGRPGSLAPLPARRDDADDRRRSVGPEQLQHRSHRLECLDGPRAQHEFHLGEPDLAKRSDGVRDLLARPGDDALPSAGRLHRVHDDPGGPTDGGRIATDLLADRVEGRQARPELVDVRVAPRRSQLQMSAWRAAMALPLRPVAADQQRDGVRSAARPVAAAGRGLRGTPPRSRHARRA